VTEVSQLCSVSANRSERDDKPDWPRWAWLWSAVCLMCLEGSDCEKEASCEECSGVACTRITSYNLEDNKEVALTCIPYDTRTFGRAHLEEAGCRLDSPGIYNAAAVVE
ncbi:hypothetical protein TELCIR_05247, partial [Teladorsagia circumcincta]